jgi:GTPase SAR1 family protein
MTRSLYIIGGAGSGKSTFMEELLASSNHEMGPLRDLHTKNNARGNPVTLRGHELAFGWSSAGLYLGCMREFYPGTDGLDRASSIAGEEWLEQGGADAYSYIIAEGATLATRRFLYALQDRTELLLVHLFVDELIADLRFLQRGSSQDPRFVLNTVTRSANLLRDMKDRGALTATVDTADIGQWSTAQKLCLAHLFE